MKTHDKCKRCGVALSTGPQLRGICPACAKRERAATRRYFRNGLMIGLILAALLFLVLRGLDSERLRLLYSKDRPDHPMVKLMSLTDAQRALWALWGFAIPFGYIHQSRLRTSPIDELNRNTVLLRQGTGIHAMNAREGAGVGFLIIGIVLAPITAPFCAVYRLVRLFRLRRFMRQVETGYAGD